MASRRRNRRLKIRCLSAGGRAWASNKRPHKPIKPNSPHYEDERSSGKAAAVFDHEHRVAPKKLRCADFAAQTTEFPQREQPRQVADPRCCGLAVMDRRSIKLHDMSVVDPSVKLHTVSDIARFLGF